MRLLSVKVFGLVGVTGAAVIASVLVLASGSTAAGKNICLNPSTIAASCVTELAAPHFISPGADALSVTKFKNESGSSGGTATHVVIAVGFSSPVNVSSITLAVNGSAADATGCTTTPATPPATGVISVSCPVGNIAGGGTAILTVRFATTTTTTTLNGTATYGEGSGTPGQPTNSVQGNTDTVTVTSDGSASGGCFDIGGTNQPTTATVTGSNSLQSTSATVGPKADSSFPCTFADAGVFGSTPSNSVLKTGTQISFVEFPTLAGGYGTVVIKMTPLPDGLKLNTAKILEDTNYAVPYFKTYITVPKCDKFGNIPTPPPVGIPPKGATDPSPSNDSCIFNRSPLPAGGGEFDLHVIGSPFDGHYGT
jgi:hypothetical protein